MIKPTSKAALPSRPRSKALKEPDAPAHATWHELVRVDGLVRRLSEPHFSRFGLSSAQWGVLRSLARLELRGTPEPRMRELGAELLVRPPSLSATLGRMVRAGLVVSREDQEDQRSRRIALTARGRHTLDGALLEHRAWIDGLMKALTHVEQRRLGVLLSKLSRRMSALIDGPSSAGVVPKAVRTRRARRSI